MGPPSSSGFLARDDGITTKTKPPTTAAAFEKEWRRLRAQGAGARVALLRSVGGAAFIQRRLSGGGGEMGPDLLGEVVEALRDARGVAATRSPYALVADDKDDDEAAAAARTTITTSTTTPSSPAAAEVIDNDDDHEVLACLDALAATPRFALHWALLSPGQQAAGRELVAGIAARTGDNGWEEKDVLVRVQKAFA